VDRTLQRGEEEGLLDDAAFVRLWVVDRLTHRPRARRAVERELIGKGIAPALLAESIRDLYPPQEETRLALEAARERLEMLTALPKDVQQRRVFSYLVRRGFSPHLARGVLRTLEREGR
jgi:regulatory protein